MQSIDGLYGENGGEASKSIVSTTAPQYLTYGRLLRFSFRHLLVFRVFLKQYLKLHKSREGRDLERGCSPPQDMGSRTSGGITPVKILKFETQFGATWCILATN